MNRIEAINCKKLVGKTVTASFWAKCISGSTSQVVGLDYPINSADDNYTSSTAQIGSFLFATTSTWTKFIFSWVIPTGATKGLQFRIITGASSAAVIRVADVQLEEGSTASAFEMPPYSLELAQCQRYYRRINDPTSAYGSIALGINSSATIGQFIITGLGMRPGSATATISGLQTLVGGAVTTITTALITANGDAQVTITTGTNAVNAVNLLLQANNTAGYLDLSREL